jgi:hypothetical protein
MKGDGGPDGMPELLLDVADFSIGNVQDGVRENANGRRRVLYGCSRAFSSTVTRGTSIAFMSAS